MTQVTASGPLFDGRAQAQVGAMTEEIVRDVAEDAHHEVLAALDAFLVNPTGYYESQITTTTVRETSVVHDSGVVYGPWLAGVSSLNDRSRFKGYAHWQRAKQRAEAKVPQTAAPTVRRRVARMNS